MALDQSALLELSEALRTADSGELMRSLLHTMLQALIDAEATAQIGAVALHAVVMQAYVEGVSTRKVDDLVAALGVESGISKSEVSRICAGLDADVAAWRTRALGEQPLPYVFLDATYCKARVNRPRRLPRGGHRHRGGRRRPAGGAGGRRRGQRERGALDRLPPEPARPRLAGVMNEFASLADLDRGGQPDLKRVSMRLATTPCGPLSQRHISPDREVAALIAGLLPDHTTGPAT